MCKIQRGNASLPPPEGAPGEHSPYQLIHLLSLHQSRASFIQFILLFKTVLT